MNEQQNVQAVQTIYATLERRDLPGAMAYFNEDVDWRAYSPDLSLSAPRKGHAGVVDYFTKLSQTLNVEEFQVREYVAQDDKVIALGNITTSWHATGQKLAESFAMVWTLRNGKVVRFQGYVSPTPMVSPTPSPANTRIVQE
jgi:ketosteroid isomerase-like protein